jgi:hypothetical protein
MSPQALINKHQGKGRKIVSGNAVKERIDFKEVIGEVLDPKTGKWVKTTHGMVHTASDGTVHIVPILP